MLRNLFWHSLEDLKINEKSFHSKLEKPSMHDNRYFCLKRLIECRCIDTQKEIRCKA
jgi:hypothetical protein